MVARDRIKLPSLRVDSSILSCASHEDRSALAREPESTNGGQGQNRTADTGIFSPLLYRLSYLAIRSCMQARY